MATNFWINLPSTGAPTWKDPVVNAAALPIVGNTPGDARIDLSTDTIYVWTGSAWVAVATPGAAIAIDGLTADVSASGPGVVPATVNFVGGVSAANVASGANAANAATSSNTPNTIVKRDGSGNFAAGTITANLTGTASGNLTPTSNIVRVQTNPGAGDFASVATALASITTNSSTNSFVIQIGPGIYTEPQLVMKPFVTINGEPGRSTILIPSTTTQAFIVGSVNATVSNVVIKGATGVGGIGISYNNTDLTTAENFRVFDCVFGSNETLLKMTNTGTSVSGLFIEDIYTEVDAQFTTGFDLQGPAGTGLTALVGSSVFFLTYAAASQPTDFIKITGPSCLHTLTNFVFIASPALFTGNGIEVNDGANVSLIGPVFRFLSSAITVDNTGAAPSITMLDISCSANIVDLSINHAGTTGSITGSFSSATSTVAGSSLSVVITEPTGGLTFTGDLVFGTTFNNKTDVTNLILDGPTMGIYTGGVLSNGGGLVVNVASGTGYFSLGVPTKFFTWTSTTKTLSANSSNYIYFDNAGVLQANSNFPNTELVILLGRVVTNASTLEFIDASPLDASQYGNLNDNFIRNALGPVYQFGSIVSENATPKHLNITSGSYYFGNNHFLPTSGTNITFDTFYSDGAGGQTIGSTNVVDTANYDNGSGTLAAIPGGQFTRHTLYLVGDGSNQKYLFIYGQALYASLALAQAGNIPIPPSYFVDGVVLVASLIVLSGAASIVAAGGAIVDNRPRIGFATPAVAATGTVSSVALSLPSIFTVTGSPVTSAGTLTGTLNTQTANTIFSGPTSGGAAVPTFRSLVSADIPNNAANTTGTASNITASSNSTLTTLSALSLPGAQVTGNISGNAANVTGIVAIANGGTGNTTAAAAYNALSPMTTTGDLEYESATNVASRLPIGSTGQLLTVVAGVPAWASPATGGTVTSVALADSTGLFNITGSPVTTTGTLTLASLQSQATKTFFAAPNGGAGSPTFRLILASDIPTLNQNTTGTASNITASSNSTLTTLSALSLPSTQLTGTLQAAQEPAHTGDVTNSAGSLALSLVATTNSTLTTLSALSLPGSQVTGNISGNAANVTGIVAVANGGTALSTTPTNGQLLIGNGTNYTLATLTAGTRSTITNGVGSITIAGKPIISTSSQITTYTLVEGDRGNLVKFTGSAATTFNITAAATLGAGWYCYVENAGTGVENAGQLTFDGNASETIDGLTTMVIYPRDVRLLICDGSNFVTELLAGGYVQYTTSGASTFTVPSKVNFALVNMWGGGGGGASGRRGAAAAVRSSGTGGGGGAFVEQTIRSADLGTSVTVTVAATAAGGAAITADTTNGNNGTNGNNSTFGTLFTAYGGGGGTGGGGAANGNGGGGGGSLTAAALNTGGGPNTSASPTGFGGANGGTGNGSENGLGGAAGGGHVATGAAGNTGGSSHKAGAGGGSGGGISAADAVSNGAAGGSGQGTLNGGGGAGGTAGGSGTAGTAGPSVLGAGTGGGGGASSITTTAGSGGNGGISCGGGGGGASLNGNNSGAGGNGGAGLVRIWYG